MREITIYDDMTVSHRFSRSYRRKVIGKEIIINESELLAKVINPNIVLIFGIRKKDVYFFTIFVN